MESKRIEAQVGKVLSFKSQVGKMKTGQTTGEFTVISPIILPVLNQSQCHSKSLTYKSYHDHGRELRTPMCQTAMHPSSLTL